jgi:dCMP deaminase
MVTFRQQQAYMDVALRFAELSYANKLKVGAIAVKNDRIISIGYNGTPAGWPNECEDVVATAESELPLYITKPEVIHAEMNCIAKLARCNESGEGAAMFITHSPCINCAKAIAQSGINSVFYRNEYKKPEGIDFLQRCGVQVTKI